MQFARASHLFVYAVEEFTHIPIGALYAQSLVPTIVFPVVADW